MAFLVPFFVEYGVAKVVGGIALASATAGIVTRTTLTSPSFSLVGYTGASLSLWHFLRYTAFDTVTSYVNI